MLSGEEVAKSAIYSVLKNRLANSDEHLVANELRTMQKMSLLYAHIVGLTSAGNPKIAMALSRLRRWEVATANTFILRVLKINEDDGQGRPRTRSPRDRRIDGADYDRAC